MIVVQLSKTRFLFDLDSLNANLANRDLINISIVFVYEACFRLRGIASGLIVYFMLIMLYIILLIVIHIQIVHIFEKESIDISIPDLIRVNVDDVVEICGQKFVVVVVGKVG